MLSCSAAALGLHVGSAIGNFLKLQVSKKGLSLRTSLRHFENKFYTPPAVLHIDYGTSDV